MRLQNALADLRNPNEAKIIRNDAKESLRMLTEDLKSITADHEIFRTPGVSSRAEWLKWCEDTRKQMEAPRNNSAISRPSDHFHSDSPLSADCEKARPENAWHK